jgi:hypothetical protein
VIGPSAQGPRMPKISPQANGWKSTFSKCHLNTHNQLCSLRRTQVWQLVQGYAIDRDKGDRGQARKANACRKLGPRPMDGSQHVNIFQNDPNMTQHKLLHFFETDASTKHELLHFLLKRTQVQNINFFIFC